MWLKSAASKWVIRTSLEWYHRDPWTMNHRNQELTIGYASITGLRVHNETLSANVSDFGNRGSHKPIS
jgi:hypothetical protein